MKLHVRIQLCLSFLLVLIQVQSFNNLLNKLLAALAIMN